MKTKSRTSELTKAILALLKLRGYFAWRNQAGTVATKSGHFMRFGSKGVADVIAFGRGLWLAIEIKQGRDKLSPEQVTFKAAWESNRGIFIEARDVDDVLKIIS
jgi:hypothetical protein